MKRRGSSNRNPLSRTPGRGFGYDVCPTINLRVEPSEQTIPPVLIREVSS